MPDERTVRYYGTLGLLDRPLAMRGRTALYGKKHAAQVIAIKRLQTMDRSLNEIRQMWHRLDEPTLTRMSGIALDEPAAPAAGGEFWKRAPVASAPPPPEVRAKANGAVEVRIELAPHVVLSLSVVDESVTISPADVRAIRDAVAPLVAALASRRLTPHPARLSEGEEP